MSEMVFQLHGRPLHPELFDILAERRVQYENYCVRIWVTRTGHVVTWDNEHVLLTEVADASPSFSPSRRLLNHRMRGEHSVRLVCAHNIVYQSSFQVEQMSDEIFLHVHDEILADGAKRGLLHNFHPHHRLALAPLAFLTMEAKRGCLFFASFHTFPDENTVVKTQSLIEMPH